MGLDMYLSAEKYVSGWENTKDKTEFYAIAKATGIAPTQSAPSFIVKANVGYWRKANAIHRWFVEHVQGGRDECQSSNVTREQLAELRAACQKVLGIIETVPGTVADGTTLYSDGRVENRSHEGTVIAQPSIAATVLPTTSGFFFGSTDYDEGYIADLRDTVEIIDRVLADPALADCDFTYRASW